MSEQTKNTVRRRLSLRRSSSLNDSNLQRFSKVVRNIIWSSNDTKEKRAEKVRQFFQKTSSSSLMDFSPSFLNVAKKVVSSKRAAKGLRSIWRKESGIRGKYLMQDLHLEKKKLDLRLVSREYKEMKRNQFYQELVVYAVFLLFFFLLLDYLPVYQSNQQNQVISEMICDSNDDCDFSKSRMDDIYSFADSIRSKVCQIPQYTLERNHSQMLIRAEEKEYIPNYRRIVNVTLRQIRTKPLVCELHKDIYTMCYKEYASETEAREPIQGHENRTYHWSNHMPKLEINQRNSFFNLFVSSSNEYGTGGYLVDLCQPNSSIDYLKEDHWIDQSTRAVSIEFSLLNPNTKILTVGQHIFTISLSGHIQYYSQSSNIGVFSFVHTGYLDPRTILFFCIVGFFITYILVEYTEVSHLGVSDYLRLDPWNIFEIMHLYCLGCVLYRIYYFSIECETIVTALKTSSLIEYHTIKAAKLLSLLRQFRQLIDIVSLASAVSLLKIFKFLRMNSTLNLLWHVLGMALKDLMGFLIIFNLIFLSYSLMGKLAFGLALEEFSTVLASYSTCFQMLAGNFDYDRLKQANPRVAPIFFGCFVVLVLQILVNMFIAILSEYYEIAKQSSADADDLEYDLINRFKLFLSSCSPAVVMPEDQSSLVLKENQTVKLISTNLLDKEMIRYHAKRLFRGAVWRIIALLRLGMNFEQRVVIDQWPKHHKRKQKSSCTPILLSDNFDYVTIKNLLPEGIDVQLRGDSLLGTDIVLRVVGHSDYSIECLVLGAACKTQENDTNLELMGGEVLCIPWQRFLMHLFKTTLRGIQVAIMRATRIWDANEARLIDNYHLHRLLVNARADGRPSLRFDELYRLLDLYFRKEHGGKNYSSNAIREEAAVIMYRFKKSLIDVPSREKEGYNYVPKPVDTSMVELGSLEFLSELLAENCHEIWALERLRQGWKYGDERDDNTKLHPNLVPYFALSKDEQAYDYRTSMETLKTILSLNFVITRVSRNSTTRRQSLLKQKTAELEEKDETETETSRKPPLARNRRVSSIEDIGRRVDNTQHYATYKREQRYYPRPIDTSDIVLPQRLSLLVDLLAENAHEVWSKGRMDDGWLYGPIRDDKTKKHPCLVPFVFLTDEEKEYDVNTAMGTLRVLFAMGFNVHDKRDLK